MTLDEVDLVVFHQANMRIISAAVEELSIDPHKVFNNLQRYGNTSSASIPLALDEAIQEGRIQRGQHVLFSGFGGVGVGNGVDEVVVEFLAPSRLRNAKLHIRRS